MSEQPTTYKTAGGATVTLGSRINGFGKLVRTYECGGCGGIRGYKAAHQASADAGAQDHAERCTDKQPKSN